MTGFTVLTILWGALVRATSSGAGCGGHWPTCEGELLLLPRTREMWFELPHRLSSGLLIVLMGAVVFFSRRALAPGHPARKAAVAAGFVIVLEALLGAGLVLFGLVGDNDSLARAVVIAVHLTNTLILLAAISLTAWHAGRPEPVTVPIQGRMAAALVLALVSVAVVGATGAVTALGDTLFPGSNLASAVRDDLSPTAHLLMRLRMIHPLLALAVAGYLIWIATLSGEVAPAARRSSLFVTVAVLVQTAVGFVNVYLMAPIVLQVVHLLLADLLWIGLIVMTVSVLHRPRAEEVEIATMGAADASATKPIPAARVGVRRLLGAYLAVTKPRIISLLLFTTLAAMFVAAGGWPGGTLLVAVAIGGYMAAGAANAFNMLLDRDIDARMERTSSRPTVTQFLPSRNVFAFASLLTVGSFALLWQVANLLTALLAMVGLLYYVLIYTIWLKRRTWHNIVIGGAAGAIPPLVGWAAVTGELNPLAWYLFAIIFLWTPVHFWALALLIKDDYARTGVPMLPVVRGERATVVQIVVYALLTAAISIIPFFQSAVGMGYLVVAVALNLSLLARAFRLYRTPAPQTARALFKYSLVYLALLFLALAADRSTIGDAAVALARSVLQAG